ncbi:hypothetical protein CO662_23830 [Rhizobium anhuiense]|uniref:Uncharacterized protein n=1 Tax=Rhizobium anhuiense TaxID=1184720 RepID=A0A3S0QIC6_9HYPH|nr:MULTISPECIES: hypothetical protein [Rhizobium]NKM57981.1 hypothetical protein [Rhizobium anhuiense]PDS34048.1 hypothetical protein CO665_32760 [Rhizobium anhuiense]PDS41369.1 hypothetical protein CO668_28665 [Rhizobium anhuiense]PDS49616.1 hypothetical protein CO662_23830 [Rhizobium anhuiense]PDS55545.1 hypothetical protein CO663_29890 [Rhizobium anhuiense]
MSVPNEPIVPPPSPPPVDTPPRDPDRIPGEEPLPDPEPDEGASPRTRASVHRPTWDLLCRGIRLQPENGQ